MKGNRRRLLAAAGAAGLAGCLPTLVLAQKVARVGVLSPAAQSDATARAQFTAFTERLRELGYVEGKTLALEWRFADGQYDRLSLLAGELVKAKVEVIVTNGMPATTAAKRATATVAIVAVSLGDPVGSGFARSLERPGGNVTGLATMESAVDEKRIELLLEAVPGAKRIGLLVNADRAFYLRELPGLEAAAKKQGCEIVLANVHSVRDLKEGFAMLATRRVAALLVGDDPFLNSQTGAIAGQALHYKLPAVFPSLRGVEDGGLLGYVNDAKQRYRSAADYVDKILRGAKPGELPIEQPMKFDLAVNKRTAAALGITVPASILARASKVIE
jgi:putative ABC transport system substrate-binding protein